MADKKIKKCQKKIAKYTKKLQKYRDLLVELTADKEEAPAQIPVTPAPVEQPKHDERKRTPSVEEKKSAVEATPVVATLAEQSKPVRRRRTTSAIKKKPATEAAPVETIMAEHPKPSRRRRTSSEDEKKPVRRTTRKAAPVNEELSPTEQTKPTRRKRTPSVKEAPARRASFVLYNCDEVKSPESKYNRNDETFSDSQRGRRGLWNKLKNEITEGRIVLLDGYPIRNVRLEIQSGSPESVSKHLKYGLIEKV